MAYCTITEVEALNPQRGAYSASTKPTSTQVEAHIVTISDELDTIIAGRGLTVPVTAPAEFLSHLKQVNAYGAAALAEMGMFPEAGGLGTSPQGDRLWGIYTRALEFIKTGKLPVTAQSGDPSSFFEENTGDTEPSDEYEWRRPKFRKNMDF